MKLDRVFEHVTRGFAASLVVVVVLIGFMLFKESLPAMRTFGWQFPATQVWDPVADLFGGLPFIYGTLVSSCLALIIAVPLSLGIAIFLSELAPPLLKNIVSFLTEILAAIPSVIYGLWGIFYLAPWLRTTVEPLLAKSFGFLPFFQGPPYGIGMLAAGMVLAIMIIPIIASISRDVLQAVPEPQREAALALGATRWETTRVAVLSYGRHGIVGAIFLGLGRALGETMAVTMVIGNRPAISASLFAPAHTMASVIANEFSEATGELYTSALFGIGLVLFSLTLFLNAGARWLVRSTMRGAGGGRE
ncbi:MAG: phosphate ABC transporter permease subunit PstC [Deltaproteobacteria bacterium]|nr:phosphate ABC transporter permease subunit PstC [Deltaproteobacteria bacterium]